MADGFAIDAAGDVLDALAHDEAGNAAGELDHFDPRWMEARASARVLPCSRVRISASELAC